MALHINELARDLNTGEGGIPDSIRRANNSYDGAIMIGIAFRAQHRHAARAFESADDAFDDRLSAPFGKIRHAFYQPAHGLTSPPARLSATGLALYDGL